MAASLADVQALGTAVREEFKTLFDELHATHAIIEKESWRLENPSWRLEDRAHQ